MRPTFYANCPIVETAYVYFMLASAASTGRLSDWLEDVANTYIRAFLRFSFIVMTLCGPDLMFLKKIKGQNGNKRDEDRFSEVTIVRIAVHCLYAIKQLHEIGFVHRDVKPGNMVIGQHGRDARSIFMIDYGKLLVSIPYAIRYIAGLFRNGSIVRVQRRKEQEVGNKKTKEGNFTAWNAALLLNQCAQATRARSG